MQYLIIASIVFISNVCIIKGQLKCITPDGVSGSCKSVYECESLLAIVKNSNKSSAQIDFLKKSQCGFQGNTPEVCCPLDSPASEAASEGACSTPDGGTGKCIDVTQCEHIVDMLKQPNVTPEKIASILNSRCSGPAEYSVCCAQNPTTTMSVQNRGGCETLISAFPPDPATRCCGIDSQTQSKLASVGGTASGIDQYPWLALIDYHQNGIERHMCGGVLISGKYVLTAAHCVVGDILKFGSPKIVRLGEYKVSEDGPDCVVVEGDSLDCTDGVLKVHIESITPHPDYVPNTLERRNDIALIRLKDMAPYTDFIRPICLAQSNPALNPVDNFPTFVAGWGAINTTHSSSDVKVHVDLPFVTEAKCQLAYDKPGQKVQLWDKQVCAGGVKGKDSCKGDSGGPLMYENRYFQEAIGVVSFGPTVCGTEDLPGVYTNVFLYKDWILSNIKP